MTDEKNGGGGATDALMKGAEAANKIRGAVKTGKTIAAASKGAAAGGPYGAAAGFLWENRVLVGKILAAAAFLLMLPILFIMMLPSLIFGGLSDSPDIPVMNDGTAVYQNIAEAEGIVSRILQEQHDATINTINEEIGRLGENSSGVIVDDYASGAPFNNFMLISQYSASKNFAEINLTDFKRVIESKKSHLFSYTTSSYTTKNDDEETHM